MFQQGKLDFSQRKIPALKRTIILHVFLGALKRSFPRMNAGASTTAKELRPSTGHRNRRRLQMRHYRCLSKAVINTSGKEQLGKLAEEAHIILEQKRNFGDAVLHHGETIYSHAECETG